MTEKSKEERDMVGIKKIDIRQPKSMKDTLENRTYVNDFRNIQKKFILWIPKIFPYSKGFLC